MKIAGFYADGAVHLGLLISRGLADITRFAADDREEGAPRSLDEALNSWDSALAWLAKFEGESMKNKQLGKYLVDPSNVKFAPPVSRPSKILCVYVNYRTHGREVGATPTEPIFFLKHANCIVGDRDDVVIPAFSTKPDHEVELGVIIGRRGRDVQPGEAYDHVAGYTVLNDVSFRDGMTRGVAGTPLGRNLFKGKVADTALPMGPYIVTRDEIPDPYPLSLKLRVNGEERQSGTTDDMIFKVPDLIASASEGNTLLPGDVISTGTCSGVGLYTGIYLKDGDAMEAEIEKIGKLRNTVRMQRNPASKEV